MSIRITDAKTKKQYYVTDWQFFFSLKLHGPNYYYTNSLTTNQDDATYFFIHQGDDRGPLVENEPMYFTSLYSQPVDKATLVMDYVGSNLCPLQNRKYSNVYWKCSSKLLPQGVSPPHNDYDYQYGMPFHLSLHGKKKWEVIVIVLVVLILFGVLAWWVWKKRKEPQLPLI